MASSTLRPIGTAKSLARYPKQIFLAVTAAPACRTLKTFHGPKYQAKIDAAQESWDKKKALIEEGKLPALWDIFEERGYVKDVAGTRQNIRQIMLDKRIGAYVGIDPTAPSLHIGHLLPLMPLFWMYLHGYHAFSLVGGATAKIGDPTGRLQSREVVRSSTIAMHMAKIHFQLKKLWVNVEARGRHYGYQSEWAWERGVLENGHWWNKLPMLDVLRRLGSGIRIGPMLSRDTVKRKLTEGDGMSFAEFAYPLMQTWDWWQLYVRHNVQMQIGGSDQYGNIVTGAEGVKAIRDSEPNLEQKMPGGPLNEPVGFTVPLLTDSSGAKFGKSAGNAVWLDQYMTNSFDLYGYFVRRPDEEVEKLLHLFTFIPSDNIKSIMAEHTSDPPKRVAQHALALEVLCLVHGAELAQQTQEQHRAMYDKTYRPTLENGDDTSGWRSTTRTGLGEYEEVEGHPTTPNNAPRINMKLPESLIRAGNVPRILYAARLVPSVKEGQRLAVQKGVYIGGSPGQKAHLNKGMPLHQLDFTTVSLWFPQDTQNFIIDDKYLILRKGKHNVRIVEIVSDEEWKASGEVYPGQPGTGQLRMLQSKIQALREELRLDVDESREIEEGKEEVCNVARAIKEGLDFPEEKSAKLMRAEEELSRLEEKKKTKRTASF